MATYEQIQVDIRKTHDRVVKNCWIADVKASFGLTQRKAHNRISADSRTNPCPAKWRPAIEDSMRRFKMIK